jgi:hypothetical protein
MKKHEIDSMEAVQVGEAYEEGISSLCRSRKDITEEMFRKQIGFNWHRLQACLSLAAEKKPMPWETWPGTALTSLDVNTNITLLHIDLTALRQAEVDEVIENIFKTTHAPPTRWQRVKAFAYSIFNPVNCGLCGNRIWGKIYRIDLAECAHVLSCRRCKCLKK